MPIYEYRCESCGHQLDALQKVSEAALTECPACGQVQLRRLVSAPRFRLKGSGWYETDFKQDNRRNLAGEGKDKAGEPGGKSGEAAAKPDGGSGKTAEPASGKSGADTGSKPEKKADSGKRGGSEAAA